VVETWSDPLLADTKERMLNAGEDLAPAFCSKVVLRERLFICLVPGQDIVAVFPVAFLSHAVVLAHQCRLLTEVFFDFSFRPDIVFPPLAFAVGIQGRIKSSVR